ncbi:MAG: tRNA lysidine(34) synthetase TilS [Dehalococcoidia bacterium]|nr:tRNA lysidine(34) synthetase TilS [Dehalococcoidia bacterium]MDW8120410.1 tRNA lysidine(34) synthetase TilS [Chloroflexota bacterium]
MRPDPSDSLVRKVARSLEGAGMGGKALLVAVSGGPDSLALLYALHTLGERYALRLFVGTVDHRLRPTSAQEAQVVAQHAQALGLPCQVLTADVRSYQRAHRLTLEQAAREVRYTLLAQTLRARGADALTLGHTATDQAETLLLHMARGAGLTGLRGMRVLSPLPTPVGPVQAFRPLLECHRRETEAFCQRWGLTPCVDESNRDLRFARNRVRWGVLPALRALNPQVEEALVRLARTAEQVLDYLDSQVARVREEVVSPVPSGVGVDTTRWRDLHPALQRHLLRTLWGEVAGTPEGLTQAHVESMVTLLGGPAGRRLALPRGIVLECGYGRAWLVRRDVPCPLPTVAGEVILRIPGTTPLDGWEVHTRCVEPPVPYREAGPLQAYLDADAVGMTLRLRTRRPGDRFWPLGMPGPKRLHDFLVDAHIPRRWRERLALLEGREGIAWVLGVRIAHWARVTPQTRRVLVAEARPAQETASPRGEAEGE